jgi:hypothetical protein
MVQSQPGHLVLKTTKRAGGVAQMVVYLLHKHEALSLNKQAEPLVGNRLGLKSWAEEV